MATSRSSDASTTSITSRRLGRLDAPARSGRIYASSRQVEPEVNSIIWPYSAFDNSITVYGPEVRALVVQRYLTQMIAELGALPPPDDGAATLLDGIELAVPHQANKTMVTKLATDAGLAAESLSTSTSRASATCRRRASRSQSMTPSRSA
jgi:hypothetical protein